MLSIQEMNATPQIFFDILPPTYWSLLRLAGIFIVGFCVLLLSRHLFPKHQKISQLYFFILPWVYIVSHEFNPIVLFFLLLLTGYIVASSLRRLFLIVLICYTLFIGWTAGTLNIDDILDKAAPLLSFFNVTQLFLQMEPISSYLRVPRSGYFPAVFLIPLLFSFINFNFKALSKGKEYVLPVLVTIIFFLIYPTYHLVMSGAGLLLFLSIYIIKSLVNISKNRLVIFVAILMSIVSFTYFLEGQTRQYPRRYSGERSEGIVKIMEYIIDHPNEQFYLPRNDDLIKLTKYYRRHADLSKITFVQNDQEWNDKIGECINPSIHCMLDDVLLVKQGIEKDSPLLQHIKLKNTLTVYYIY